MLGLCIQAIQGRTLIPGPFRLQLPSPSPRWSMTGPSELPWTPGTEEEWSAGSGLSTSLRPQEEPREGHGASRLHPDSRFGGCPF